MTHNVTERINMEFPCGNLYMKNVKPTQILDEEII